MAIAPSRASAEDLFGPIGDSESTADSNGIFNVVTIPAVGPRPDGSVVFAWKGPVSRTVGVYARLFGADLQPTVTELRVDATAGAAIDASANGVHVAVGTSGAFVVAWSGTGTSVTSAGITYRRGKVIVQRFDAAGTAIGVNLEVSTTLQADLSSLGTLDPPVVGVHPDGSFVVAWNALDANAAEQIVTRRFGADGAPLDAAERVVAQVTRGSYPTLAITGDGGHWLAWQSFDGTTFAGFAQRFDASGEAVGAPLRLDLDWPIVAGPRPVIARGPSDGLVAAWPVSGGQLVGRRLDAAGAPLGAVFRIDRSAGFQDSYLAIASGASGDFVVTWATGTGTANQDVRFRGYDADGVPRPDSGGDTADPIASTTPDYNHSHPWVGYGPGPAPVIAWLDHSGGFNKRLRFRTFTGAGAEPPAAPPTPVEVVASPVLGNDTALTLQWQPGTDGTSETASYEIRVFRDGVRDDALTLSVPATQTSAIIDVALEGAYTFEVAALDDALGYSDFTASNAVVVDLTAPATTIVFPSFSLTDGGRTYLEAGAPIALSASDALSGVSQTFYRIDDGTAATYVRPFAVPRGAHTITFWSLDHAGNEEPAQSASVDVAPPSVAATFVGDGDALTLPFGALATLDSDLDEHAIAAWEADGTRRWQRLGLDGALVGAEESVASTYTHAAALGLSGRYVGIHQAYSQSFASRVSAYTRAHDGAGTLLGCESRTPLWTAAPLDTDPRDRVPAIDMAADGTYVAVSPWFGYIVGPDAAAPCDPALSFSYAASGTTTKYVATVAVHPDGAFVVAWSGGLSGYDREVFAQVFDADGSARGPGFLVADAARPGDADAPSIAIDLAGDFVVAWTEVAGANGSTEIRARRFAADGTPLGPSLALTDVAALADTVANQDPKVATDMSGNFVVTWTRADALGSAIQARAYNRNGAAVTDTLVIAEDGAGLLSGAAIALSYHGHGLIAYNDDATVRARPWRFDYATSPGAPSEVTLSPALGNGATLTLAWASSPLGTPTAETAVRVVGPQGELLSELVAATSNELAIAATIDGAYYAELTAYDEEGRPSQTVTSPEAIVDTEPPTLTLTLDGLELVDDSARVIDGTVLDASALDASGVSILLTLPAYNFSRVWDEPITLSGLASPFTLVFTAADGAGNLTTRTIAVTTYPRPEPPRFVTFDPLATRADQIDLHWQAPSDATAATRYLVTVVDGDGNALLPTTETAATRVTIAGLGAYDTTLTATVVALNALGDPSSPATALGHVDHTPPEVAIALVPVETPLGDAPTAILETTRITFVATDARAGVAAIHYRVDQGPERLFNGHFRLPPGPAAQTVDYWAIDAAGNASTPKSWSFLVAESPTAERFCATPPEADGYLGTSLAVDGAVALVGGHHTIWDFRWDGITWQQVGTLERYDSGPNALYLDVRSGVYALGAGTLVRSDPSDRDCVVTGPSTYNCAPSDGSAAQRPRLYVERVSGDGWLRTQTLFTDGLTLPVPTHDEIGGLATDGQRLVAIAGGPAISGRVGAVSTYVDHGAGFVFESAWQPADVVASYSQDSVAEGFDGPVALDGDRLYLSGQKGFSGRTYVYEREGEAWVERAVLPAHGPIAARGDTVVVDYQVYRWTESGGTPSLSLEEHLVNPLIPGGYPGYQARSVALADDARSVLIGAYVGGTGVVLEYARQDAVDAVDATGVTWSLVCVHRFEGALGTSVVEGLVDTSGYQVAFGGGFGLTTAPLTDVDGVLRAGCGFAMVERPVGDYTCFNGLPTADAGPDQYVQAGAGCGATVTLDGSASTDPDGDRFDYRWRIVDGPGVTEPIPAAEGMRPELFLPAPGAWQIALVVAVDGVESVADHVTVTVYDDAPPSLVGVPPDLHVGCDQIPAPAAVTATDNCAAVTVSLQETSDLFEDDHPSGVPYQITRTWTTSDGVYQVSATQTITVHTPPDPGYVIDDTVPPVAVCTSQVAQIGLPPSGTVTISAHGFASESYDACRIDARSVAPSQLTCDDLGARELTITVADAAGNSDSCTANVVVSESQPPTARCLATASVYLSADGARTVSADDIDDGSSDVCGPLVDRVVTLPDLPPPSPTVTSAASGVFARGHGERTRDDRRHRAYAIYRDVLYFAGGPITDGQELYRYPSTTGGLAQKVVDLHPGSNRDFSGKVFYLTVFDDELYFVGSASNGLGFELYAFNGTSHRLVGDFTPGAASSKPIDLTVFGDALYMVLEGATGGSTLVAWDGTALTRFDAPTDPSASPASGDIAEILGAHDGLLYLNGRGAWAGLVTYDGATFTRHGAPAVNWNGELAWPTFHAGALSFVSADAASGKELWRFDGASFSKVDVRPGTTGSNPSSLTAFGERLYFQADSGNGRSLHWAQGAQVIDLGVHTGTGYDIAATTHAVYFTTSDSWRIGRFDGTTQSWVEVNQQWNDPLDPQMLWADGARLYFNAKDDSGSITPFELMVLDDPGSTRVFTCDDVGTSFRARLTVTDEESQTASCDSTVTLASGALLTCEDLALELVGTSVSLDPAALDGTDGAVVACGGSLSASHSALSCADRAEPVDVTLTYDNGGFTQSCVSQVSVVDVSPPTASCVAATELSVVAWDQHFAWRIGGGDFTIDTPIPGAALDAGSTDNCGVDSLTLTRADTLGPALFSEADVGETLNLSLTASDGDNDASCEVPVTVLPLAEAHCVPLLDLQLGADGTATLTPAMLDDGSSVSLGELQLALSGEPSFDCADAGQSHTVELVAASSVFPAASATCTTTVTVVDPIAPSVGLVSPSTRTLDATGELTLTAAAMAPEAADNCGIARLEIRALATPSYGEWPSEATFTCADVGFQTYNVRAVDGSGNVTTEYGWFDLLEPAPVIVTQAASVVLDASGQATLGAADLDGGSYAACGLASLEVSPSMLTCADVGDRAVTLTATSTRGTVSSETATVRVVDEVPPALVAPPPATLPTDPGVAYKADYAIQDLGYPQVWTDNCAIVSPTIDHPVLQLGDNLVTWTLSDTFGNTVSDTQLVTIVDLEPPTFVMPADLVVATDPGQCSAAEPALCDLRAPGTWTPVALPSSGYPVAINERGQVLTSAGDIVGIDGVQVRHPGSSDLDEHGGTVGSAYFAPQTRAFFSDGSAPAILDIPHELQGVSTSTATSHASRINREGTVIIGNVRVFSHGLQAPLIWTRTTGGAWTMHAPEVHGVDINTLWIADLDPTWQTALCSYGSPERVCVAAIDLESTPPRITVTPLPEPQIAVTDRPQRSVALLGADRAVGMYWPGPTETRAIIWRRTSSGWEIERELANPDPYATVKHVHVWDASAAGVLVQLSPGLTIGAAQTVLWTLDGGFAPLDLAPSSAPDWVTPLDPMRINERGVLAGHGTYLPWNGARALLLEPPTVFPAGAEACDAFDNVAVAAIDSDAAGGLAVGDNVVTWTATDTSDNSVSVGQHVRVEDREAPAITVASITVETDPGKAYATGVDLGVATASDNCGGDLQPWSSPLERYELGDNAVSWAVSDGAGNYASGNQTVTVVDLEPPTFAAPGDLVLGTDGQSCDVGEIDLCAAEGGEVVYQLMPLPSLEGAIGLSDVPSVLFADGSLMTMSGAQTTLSAAFDIDAAGVVYGGQLLAGAQSELDMRASSWRANIEGEPTIDELLTPIGSAPSLVLRASDDGTALVGVYLDSGFQMRLALWWRDDAGWTVADAGLADPSWMGPAVADATLVGVDGQGRLLVTEWVWSDMFGQEVPESYVLAPSDLDEAGDVPSVQLDRVPLTAPAGFIITWASAGFVGDEVVGTTLDPSTGALHAAIWEPRFDEGGALTSYAVRELVAPIGTPTGGPWGIQPMAASATMLVGSGPFGSGPGFVWSEAVGLRDLLALAVDPAGWQRLTPRFVNAAGWIAGDAEGDHAAFVAMPSSATCLARDNHAVASVTNDAPTSFPVGETNVIWTITDQSGNELEVVQSVTVLDGGAPVVVTRDAQAALDAAGLAFVTAADVDGGSTDACSALSLSLDVTSFSCSDAGEVTITLTATDQSGNSASQTTTVQVVDVSAPTVVTRDAVVVLDGEGHGATTPAEIDGGSADNCGIASLDLDVTSFGCDALGETDVLLTATDGAGNSASEPARIEVRDESAPVITSCPADLVLATDPGTCARALTLAELASGLAVEDNCASGEALLATLKVSRSDGETDLTTPFARGTTTITYGITDGAGLTASCTQTVTVEDREAPVIDFADQTVFAGCGTGTAFGAASATDNCGDARVTMDIVPGTELAVGIYLVTATASDDSGNSASKTVTIEVVERLQVVFESPLRDDNVLDEIATDADVINRFKVGSTVPHRVTLYDCKGRDVTDLRAAEVTVTLAVIRDDVSDLPSSFNDVPTLYHGVGSGNGEMSYIGGHFHLNRYTKDLAAGMTYRSIVWVEWLSLPGLVAGIEDAILHGR